LLFLEPISAYVLADSSVF